MDFFTFSSPFKKSLYSSNLILDNYIPLKRKFIFNSKKLNKTLGLLILAIILKVIFQNIVGAEHTSIDGLYYVGSF